MKPTHAFAALVFASTLATGLAQAQDQAQTQGTTDTSSQPQQLVQNQSPANSSDQLVHLSPFEVASGNDRGYRADQTLVGTRFASSLQDIPASITIINRQMIDDLGGYELYQIIKYGVSGVTQDAKIGDDINIRGFRLNEYTRDGMQMVTWAPTPLFDVERVEILKGPAAMLTGDNTNIGGSVNYVTRKPTATPTGDLQITLSEDDYIRFAGNVSGPVVNQEDFKLNYRLTVGRLSAKRDKEIEDQEETFAGAGIEMYFGKNTSFLLQGYWYAQDSYLYPEDFLDTTVPVNPVNQLQVAKLNKYDTETFSPAQAKYRYWRDHDGQFSSTLLTRLTDNANIRFMYGRDVWINRERYLRGIVMEADNYTLDRQDIPIKYHTQTDTIQGDFLHRLDVNWAVFQTSLGGENESRDEHWEQSINTLPPLDTRFPGVYPNDAAYFAQPHPGVRRPRQLLRRTDTKDYYESLFVQENLSFLKDRIVLIGGLRWFFPSGTNYNLNTGVRGDEAELFHFGVHKYGAIFKILPKVSLYYTDAENVFPAAYGFADLYQSSDGLGARFQDSQGKDQEGGVKYDLTFDGGWTVSGSAARFEMYQTNIRTTGPLPDGVIGVINDPRDTAQGYEADIDITHTMSFGRWDFIATFFHGTSTQGADPGKALGWQASEFVPQKYSFLTKYEQNTGPLRGLMVGWGLENQEGNRQGTNIVLIPMTMNAFGAYRVNRHWRLELNLDNLTDKRYVIGVYLRKQPDPDHLRYVPSPRHDQVRLVKAAVVPRGKLAGEKPVPGLRAAFHFWPGMVAQSPEPPINYAPA